MVPIPHDWTSSILTGQLNRSIGNARVNLLLSFYPLDEGTTSAEFRRMLHRYK